jgi:hypothetical protein
LHTKDVTDNGWIRPDSLKRKWRAVVDQMATLKADHILVAESNLVLAA